METEKISARKDVVFECVHNFAALSQRSNTIYNIMLKLEKNTGDANAKAWFKKTMESDFDQAKGQAFTPLEQFVMELFRITSPNGGSISALDEVRIPLFQRNGYIVTPHTATSFDPVHWKNPEQFDPDRYNTAPTSHQIYEAKCQQIGFAKCPFDRTTFDVSDVNAILSTDRSADANAEECFHARKRPAFESLQRRKPRRARAWMCLWRLPLPFRNHPTGDLALCPSAVVPLHGGERRS